MTDLYVPIIIIQKNVMEKFSKVILGAYAYAPMQEVAGVYMCVELTAIHKYDRTKFPMYTIVSYDNRDWFGMPLYYDQDIFKSNNIIDKRIIGEKIDFNFISKYREGQERVIEQFSKNHKAGKTGFILEAKPGTGKTVCAIKMISIIGRNSLVIVPRENLVWQWIERIKEHSSLTQDEIGHVCGDKINWRSKKIVVALVHTLATGKLGDDFRRNFGCIVFDEVHSSVPPRTFSPVLAMFPAKIRIGMSATIKRDDGLDVIFRNHVGQVYIKGNDSGRMQAKVIAHYFKGSSGYLHMSSPTKNRRGMLLSKLANNPARNKLIVWYILSFLKSKRRVVVLSDRVVQLRLIQAILKNELKKYPEMKGVTCGYYLGKLGSRLIPKNILERVAKGANVILATYQKFDLGTDIKDLAGIIYATPHKLVKQKQGRAERWIIGKKIPVVIDIVDCQYRDAVKWFSHRYGFYTRSGVDVRKVV